MIAIAGRYCTLQQMAATAHVAPPPQEAAQLAPARLLDGECGQQVLLPEGKLVVSHWVSCSSAAHCTSSSSWGFNETMTGLADGPGRGLMVVHGHERASPSELCELAVEGSWY